MTNKTNFRHTAGTVPVILIRILLIVSAAIMLSYLLVSTAFSSLGLAAFVRSEAGTLKNHAEYIASLTSTYFERRMSDDRFLYLIENDKQVWNSSVYIYNIDKKLIAFSSVKNLEQDTRLIDNSIDAVYTGHVVENQSVMLIGVPVRSSFKNIIGAVFMVKPISNVTSAMSSILNALTVAFIMAFLIMILPVYVIVSYSIAKPIKRMTDAAENMAAGNYTAIAEMKGNGELAVLGRSLNELAQSLNVTIGDLRAERNLLYEILSGMEDGVIAFDLNGRLLRHNPAAVRLMGGSDAIPYDSDCMRTIVDHVAMLSKDEPIYDFNTNSGERILHIRMNLLYVDNNPGYILVLLHDATESARYEQSRKDYVANVSHELRTPIANIKRISEALCDGIITEDMLQKYYSHLYKESDRLSRLIDDLLELSRMQSGKLSMAKRKMDVYETVMGVADRFSRTAEENGVALITECPEDIDKVYSNEDRIEQVLIILIDNAIKHSNTENVIVRAQEINTTQITVSVENSGSISDEDMPHLFERFYKADRSHSGGGSGLGLSIASEIMALLNEKLWVTSENGKVTFAFTLARYRDK